MVTTCSKCGGEMERGVLQEIGSFGPSKYLWATGKDRYDDDPPTRKWLIIYTCKTCGFCELYTEKYTDPLQPVWDKAAKKIDDLKQIFSPRKKK